jgi:mannose-6-phosphate isomerase-like protein (cupin superfamily)
MADTKEQSAAMSDVSSIVPPLINPLRLSKEITDRYRNVALAKVNDHEVRMSVMTEQFRWHHHPDSDETFYGVDGELVIEFSDGEVVVAPGEFLTVPAGVVHRTRPRDGRSVNLTFERVGASTIFEQ